MIPKECKRLAEVDFPLALVSKHSVHESSSVRQGHPRSLHLWWARRPLAACRAILLSLLLPDPCDLNCPESFKTSARRILPRVQGHPGDSDAELRNALMQFIGDFSNWQSAGKSVFIEAAHSLIKAAHLEEVPLVADPFSGGGTIPFEALRLGCDVFASDLNPVATLLLKSLLSDIPRNGVQLIQETQRVGVEIRKRAEEKLSHLYPPTATGGTANAYLWARTVICDHCGAPVPLVRSFWLRKKSGRKRAFRFNVERHKNSTPTLKLEVFEPKKDSDIPSPTTKNGKATCVSCHTSMPSSRVMTQLSMQKGGAVNATLLAIVGSSDSGKGREYTTATAGELHAAEECQRVIAEPSSWPLRSDALAEELCPIRPSPNARGVSAPTRYGVRTFRDLFNARQFLSLMTFAKLISEADCSDAARTLLAFALDKAAIQCNAHCRWKATGESLVDMFGRHAIAMVWDFAEANPLGDGTGSWDSALEWILKTASSIGSTLTKSATVENADARHSPLPSDSVSIWFTDPPYYDSIPYSDLSDFFYVWLKQTLPHNLGLANSENGLTPKTPEAVWNAAHIVDGKPKDPAYFERAIASACAEGRRVMLPEGIGCVVFAHKTTQGWEALLTGIVNSGFTVAASWPIATELTSRVSAKDSSSLATSVHLVIRPRAGEALVGDWSEVLRELPEKVGEWMERLQLESIRGADLVFACIGPAIEIYSRYRKVEDAEGREIPLGGDPLATEPYERGFLAYVWETVGRMALEQILGTAEARARNGGAGALEEDSRLTALFLWTLQATEIDDDMGRTEPEDDETEEEEEEQEDEKPKKKKAGYTLIYDVARRFAQPLGIHLDKWEGRIIETEKGVVRLLPVNERTNQLFGDADAAAMSRRIEQDVKAQRNYTFSFMQDSGAAPAIKARKGGKAKQPDARIEALAPQEVTTLDRVHAAMLLQAGGQTNGLRALLREEQQRGPDFVRLANALSALYPKESEEKRLLDAMLLAVPRN